MTTFAIETFELTRKYEGKTAVDRLTLAILQGEIFGFLGHNGAGKTTTISLLTTLLLPTSGSAAIFGDDIVKKNWDVRQRIGYVPENVRLYNELTVAENLRFLGELSGVPDIDGRIEAVLYLLEHPEFVICGSALSLRECANVLASPRDYCTNRRFFFWTSLLRV